VDFEVKAPAEMDYARHVYHLYVIRVMQRDELQEALKKNNIFTGIHYPIPVHLQKAHADLGYERGNFPLTEQVAEEILSLPMYAELTNAEIEFVCETTGVSING